MPLCSARPTWGRYVLDARIHQGTFGEDYVRVLASAAGLVVQTNYPDVDGVDLGLKFPRSRRPGGIPSDRGASEVVVDTAGCRRDVGLRPVDRGAVQQARRR